MRIIDNYDSRNKKKIFDFLPDNVPFEKLNRQWAYKIHNQTLERLNQRGGLSILELIMNLKQMTLDQLISKYGYNYKPTESDAKELNELLSMP